MTRLKKRWKNPDTGIDVENPVFGAGKPYNDYGLGFYCTENIELAREWACSAELDGYANQYEFNTEGLSVLSLTDGEYTILHWLAILLENRKFRTGASVAASAKQYLLENFLTDYRKYDVIKGYRADDSYFSFATAFLNNTILKMVCRYPKLCPCIFYMRRM